MERYLDIDGDSGVAGYECGPGFIRVQFDTGRIYLYTDASAGAENIRQMHALAAQGNGLNSFVQRVVRTRYARRER